MVFHNKSEDIFNLFFNINQTSPKYINFYMVFHRLRGIYYSLKKNEKWQNFDMQIVENYFFYTIFFIF